MTKSFVTGWNLSPTSSEDWEIEQYFSDDGECIACVEGMGGDMPCYPHAFDPIDKVWKRGGPRYSVIEAKEWAERAAGVGPALPNAARGVPHHPIAGVDPAVRLKGERT